MEKIEIEPTETNQFQHLLPFNPFVCCTENVRNGYEKIKVTFKVKSDAPKEKIRELVELAQKRSPVFDMFPTPVQVSLQE